ncbi:PAS domain-containing protein [Deinococcus radiophilus]|uniref:PAS domain-containing protein n=1 Tax=Deinococcus radiophilus TaxID=32062 RepID=UPI003609B94F
MDGHLLGLLWSPAGVPTEVIELLNLFLGSLQRDMSAPDFQMLLTQLPMPTAWLDMNLKVLEVSRSFLELFGMQHSEVVGHTVRNLPWARPEDARRRCTGSRTAGRMAAVVIA